MRWVRDELAVELAIPTRRCVIHTKPGCRRAQVRAAKPSSAASQPAAFPPPQHSPENHRRVTEGGQGTVEDALEPKVFEDPPQQAPLQQGQRTAKKLCFRRQVAAHSGKEGGDAVRKAAGRDRLLPRRAGRASPRSGKPGPAGLDAAGGSSSSRAPPATRPAHCCPAARPLRPTLLV